MLQRLLQTFVTAATLTLVVALPGRTAELVMVEQAGCVYCAAWDEQIAPIYPKTAAGTYAPLHRIDLRDPAPEGMQFVRPAVFTPTFILIGDEGEELGRIEGYPGEDFFWSLLEAMLIDKTEFDRAIVETPAPAAKVRP
tara:strand:+ start:1690 stop:2106 length:417 start_codon:yes stop_codon:yes gene_type:complete